MKRPSLQDLGATPDEEIEALREELADERHRKLSHPGALHEVLDPADFEQTIRELNVATTSLRAELTEARETIRRLNRRCQTYEAGLAEKRAGGSALGKAFAYAWAERRTTQLDRARHLAIGLQEMAPRHDWAPEECEALGELLDALGVDDVS